MTAKPDDAVEGVRQALEQAGWSNEKLEFAPGVKFLIVEFYRADKRPYATWLQRETFYRRSEEAKS